MSGARTWGVYPASLLAGLATYWSWWYAVPPGAGEGVGLLAFWVVMGFVAGLGAGRAVLLLGPRTTDTDLSVTGRALAYAGGYGSAAVMPETWLEFVDLAGLVFIIVLALGWLVGTGEIVTASAAVVRERRAPADGEGERGGGAPG